MLVRYITEMPYIGPVRFYYEMKNSVYVLKLIPGMQPDILPYLFERYDCLVVESLVWVEYRSHCWMNFIRR